MESVILSKEPPKYCPEILRNPKSVLHLCLQPVWGTIIMWPLPSYFFPVWLFFALTCCPLNHHQNTTVCGAAGSDYSQSLLFQDAKALGFYSKEGKSSLFSALSHTLVSWVPKQLYLCPEPPRFGRLWSASDPPLFTE